MPACDRPGAYPQSPVLGVLMLQTRFPRPPGDIGHPETFAFRVRRRIVGGATPLRVVRSDDPALLPPFIAAAHALLDEGCAAISTSCGFLARWQRELQAALPVPVWSSALLQLAELQAQGRRCGVITIEAASLQPAHFDGVGADPATPVCEFPETIVIEAGTGGCVWPSPPPPQADKASDATLTRTIRGTCDDMRIPPRCAPTRQGSSCIPSGVGLPLFL